MLDFDTFLTILYVKVDDFCKSFLECYELTGSIAALVLTFPNLPIIPFYVKIQNCLGHITGV